MFVFAFHRKIPLSIHALMDTFDQDGDGFVSLEEFMSFVRGPDEMDDAAALRLAAKAEKRRVLTPQERWERLFFPEPQLLVEIVARETTRAEREVLGWTHLGIGDVLCAPYANVERTVDIEWIDKELWRPPMVMEPAGSVTLSLRFELRDPARIEEERAKTHAAAANLRCLSLSRNTLHDDGARSLACALRHNRALTHLGLEDCKIAEQGAVALAASIITNRTLTTLDLANNRLGPGGAIAVGETLTENRTLGFLDISGASNAIGLTGQEAVAYGLGVNSGLCHLAVKQGDSDLQWNPASTRYVMDSLIENQSSRLKWLDEPDLKYAALRCGLDHAVVEQGNAGILSFVFDMKMRSREARRLLLEKEIRDAQQREEKASLMEAALAEGADIEIASDDNDEYDEAYAYEDGYEEEEGATEYYPAEDGYEEEEGEAEYPYEQSQTEEEEVHDE